MPLEATMEGQDSQSMFYYMKEKAIDEDSADVDRVVYAILALAYAVRLVALVLDERK